MPPPPSPRSAAPRSASLNQLGLDELTASNLELQGKAVQDRITHLMTDTADAASHRSDSASPTHAHAAEDGLVEHLQARLATLEDENERLRSEKVELNGQSSLIQEFRDAYDKAAEDVTRLTTENERLSRAHEVTTASFKDAQEQHRAGQQRIDELESCLANKLEESRHDIQVLSDELAEVLSVRKTLEEENQRLQDTKVELVSQIDELGTQVEELRLAGQVGYLTHI